MFPFLFPNRPGAKAGKSMNYLENPVTGKLRPGEHLTACGNWRGTVPKN